MPPRATPMGVDQRRAQLIDATLPLLHEHGRGVTTRHIAEAAGVAEGTIFRVFDSKDDLVHATIEHAVDLEPFLVELAGIDPDLDLRTTLLEVVVRLRLRFQRIFALMAAVGFVGPPKDHPRMTEGRRRADAVVVALLAPYADQLRVSPLELADLVRMLTFAGTHPHLSDDRPLTPERIVDTLLHGVLETEDS